jgi:hypothetical protein
MLRPTRGGDVQIATSYPRPTGLWSPIFLGGPGGAPAPWLARLLHLAGDIESNLGPTWSCNICNKRIAKTQFSIRCNHTSQHWIYLACSNITLKQYKEHLNWTCQSHTNTKTQSIVHTTQTSTVPTRNKTLHKQQQNKTLHKQQQNKTQKQNTQKLKIVQLNVNGIKNKITELIELAKQLKPEIITIQETKLKNTDKTPKIPHYTAARLDRTDRQGED